MEKVIIDKKTYKILDFIYNKQECTVRELSDFIGIKGIEETLKVISPVMYLFESSYIAIKNPKLNILDCASYEKYVSICDNNSIPRLTPEYILVIMPGGAAHVESVMKKHELFDDQIRPLKEISKSLQEQLIQTKIDAAAADRDAKFSKVVSIIAIIVSIVAIIVG